MASPRNHIYLYSKRLLRDKNPFMCPRCTCILLPKNFESHCKERHGLNPKRACVWCWGQTSWSRGEKNRFGLHLLDCMQRIVRSSHLFEEENQWSFMCRPREFFDHPRLRGVPRAYDPPPRQIALDPPPVPFLVDELNLAAACTRLYLNLKDEADFFHISVRAVGYGVFHRVVVDEDEGRTQTLPFSTWCNGGGHRLPVHRQHRHMIVVSRPKGHFEKNVWPKIKIPARDKPCRNFPVKDKRKFNNTLHFVNALGYLSKRDSRCAFLAESPLSPHDNHFYIQTPLPKHYKIACAVQWNDGIMQLLHQENRYRSAEEFLQSPSLEIRNRKWQMLVKDIPGVRLDIRLPVSNHYRIISSSSSSTNPATAHHHHHIHLARGNKIHFERIQHPLANPPDISFYGIVGDEVWRPGKGQQTCLDTANRLIVENATLRAQNHTLGEENATTRAEIHTLREENATTREDLHTLREENATLRRRVETLLAENNEMLKQEIDRLKTEKREMGEEIERLKRELHRYREEEEEEDQQQ